MRPTPLHRVEDRRLLTGTGCYVADLRVEGFLEAAFVRSPLPHALLGQVDVSAVRAELVLTGEDVRDRPPVPMTMAGASAEGRPWPVLAVDRVRYAGQPVALVAAADRYLAEDAAARVQVDYDPLPPQPTTAAADGPPLFEGVPNVALRSEFGTPVPDDVWAGAAAVVEASFRQQLLAPTSLEARAVLAAPGADGRLTVWCSHQHPVSLRAGIAQVTGLPEERVRVRVPDAGGAFGAKSPTFPEYAAVALAALRLGRPVRWVEDRTEALTAATRGRGQDQHIRMAADATGKIVAIDLAVDADIGAYPVGAGIPMQTGLQASGPYAVPNVHAVVRSIVTTTAPTFAYRGAGRPEAAYAIERAVDQLADRLGMDRIELRRRNLVRTFPYRTPTGRTYDSGDYVAALDRAVELLDLPRWRDEQRRRRADPDAAQVGVGVICYVERTGGEPGILEEYATVERMADGTVRAAVGTSSTGQSHETVFAGIVARALRVDPAIVHVVEGDTDIAPRGNGSFASRSLQMGGAALHEAACRLAADPSAVKVQHTFSSPAAFSYGCYAAVVEVDPETGVVSVLRLVAVDDYGVVVDTTVTHGQTIGSIAQGLGQVLYEDVVLDADGVTVLADGLLAYTAPTIAEMPPLAVDELSVPNPNNPLGAKGAGEAGCIGAPPAVVNAVIDALRPADPGRLQMPLTPQTVWRAMQP